MKWYSEDELKKWMGHSITLSLLEQMEYKESRQCRNCPYWHQVDGNNGKCHVRILNYKNPITSLNTECSEGFAR